MILAIQQSRKRQLPKEIEYFSLAIPNILEKLSWVYNSLLQVNLIYHYIYPVNSLIHLIAYNLYRLWVLIWINEINLSLHGCCVSTSTSNLQPVSIGQTIGHTEKVYIDSRFFYKFIGISIILFKNFFINTGQYPKKQKLTETKVKWEKKINCDIFNVV